MNSSLVLTLAVILTACSPSGEDVPRPGDDPGGTPDGASARSVDDAAQTAPNTLTPEERAAGFELLFDGEALDGWHVFHQEGTPGWEARNGTLARVGPGGDLVTDRVFDDFELRLQWKVDSGGNSGILYRVNDETDRTFHGAPEMQVLDDAAHPDGGSRLTAAGANYGLHPAPEGVVRPAGEWNDVRLVVDGAHVEHWLNGEKVVEYELWSDEWEERVAASKFSRWPEYGMAREGRIGLQDHGDPVWYRSIRVRPLGEDEGAEGGR